MSHRFCPGLKENVHHDMCEACGHSGPGYSCDFEHTATKPELVVDIPVDIPVDIQVKEIIIRLQPTDVKPCYCYGTYFSRHPFHTCSRCKWLDECKKKSGT